MWRSVSRRTKDVGKSNGGSNSNSAQPTADEESAGLRQELAEARLKGTELEREKLAMDDSEVGDVTQRDSGASIQLAQEDSEATRATDTARLPVAFCTDTSPREYIQAAKKALGKINVLRAEAGFIWEHEYDRGAMVRPNDRLTKKGEWAHSTFPKLQRTNEVVARVDGRWCYMGTYAPAGSENVDYRAWEALPDETRETVVSLSGRARVRRQFESMLKEGKIRATKYRIRRIGSNEAFKAALLEASASQILEVGREESDSADDEHE